MLVIIKGSYIWVRLEYKDKWWFKMIVLYFVFIRLIVIILVVKYLNNVLSIKSSEYFMI